jgi:hypothetical protein
MKRSFEDYVLESNKGGAKKGSLEITKTPLEKARKFAIKEFAKFGKILDEELPDHDVNYEHVKYRAMLGHTKRKDMPVILPSDMRALQQALKSGSLDVQKPHSAETDPSDPFPEGLKGAEAEAFFTNGLRIHDGSKPDDKVNVKKGSVEVNRLAPIQEQIYYDKSIDKLAKFGIKPSIKFNKSTIFLVSADMRILDGHHRYLSAMIMDPHMKVNVLMVEMPIDKLLPLVTAFGDARGNKRNA